MSELVRLDQLTLAGLLMAFFAFSGYRRGIMRELVVTPCILLAPFLGPWLGKVLVPWVNRFYKLAMFARHGGLVSDDLSAVMEKVRQVQPLIRTPRDVMLLGTIFFVLIIFAGYVIGQWRVKGPADRTMRVLGAVIAGVNGYLLTQIVVPQLWPSQFTVVLVPTGGVLQLLSSQAAAIVVVAFVALVALGLQLARK